MFKKVAILAYIAGILDGEGCITIIRQKRKSYKLGWQYQLRIIVSNADRWLCYFLKQEFGGSVQECFSPTNTKMYRWYLTSRKALNFLEAVLPYIHIKKSQAEVAIEFQKQRILGGEVAFTDKGQRYFAIQEKQRKILKNMKLSEKRCWRDNV